MKPPGNVGRSSPIRRHSAIIDEALGALVAQHRVGEIDAAYGAYDQHPLDEADEWGDLASFRDAAARVGSAWPTTVRAWPLNVT
jgi:hypothetical protein